MAERVPTREWARRLVLLERGTGWRVSQCLGVAWPDFDRRPGELELRPDLGKSESERAGRRIPLPIWLADQIVSWWKADGQPTSGPIVGSTQTFKRASMVIREYWMASGADEALFKGRPDHAFRIALVSQVRAAGVDADAIEAYVGHAIAGVRRHYVDVAKLPLVDVAKAIPAPSRVPGVSQKTGLDSRSRYKSKG
ncbi:MAG TPA: tyrosine-type recombinase/integrase [Myxococcota bacterium]|nr:tyrosine-type recombinase/integrase [Myxococcota bacterium]